MHRMTTIVNEELEQQRTARGTSTNHVREITRRRVRDEALCCRGGRGWKAEVPKSYDRFMIAGQFSAPAVCRFASLLVRRKDGQPNARYSTASDRREARCREGLGCQKT